MKQYDVVVIGAGSAGLVASKTALGLGKSVALIEKNKIGGVCTLTGCVPSKTLIALSKKLHEAKQLESYGIKLQQPIDSQKVMTHVRATIEKIYNHHTPKQLEAEGIDVYLGQASFSGTQTIQVNNEEITFKKCILASGSKPFIPPIEGLTDYLTNETIFDLKELPGSLIILGGGPSGIEMAGALQRLGVACTVIEMNDRILPREDEELVALLSKQLRKDGINLQTSLKAIKVTSQGKTTEVTCITKAGDSVSFSAEALFIAVGRRPDLKGLNLEKAGIKLNQHTVKVSNTLRTTSSHVYACGDLIGPYRFSHMAEYQAVTAVRNALFPFKKKVNYTQRVWVTFSQPELATAGLSETEARTQYKNITIYRRDYTTSDRAIMDGETFGLAKIICDSKGYILGAHILGSRAGELISEIQVGKYYNYKLADFYKVIHPYPTYSEIIWQASKKAYIDRLRNNPLLKVLRFLLRKK